MDSPNTQDHRPSVGEQTHPSSDVEELLCRVEEAQDAGISVSPEELSLDCTELLGRLVQRIKVLQEMRRFLGVTDDGPATGSMTPVDATLTTGSRLPPIPADG